MIARYPLAALTLLTWVLAPTADAQQFDQAQALALSQAAVGKTLGDHYLQDSDGRPVRLAEWRGRPLVISLVYTSCYHSCSVLTNHLAKVVEIAREALGTDSFTVVSIGFDAPVDTPEQMASYARARGVGDTRWRFLSGDAATIEILTQELGFVFFPSPKGFDHTAQTSIVDAEGIVYRQIYGESFQPPALVEPLKQLVFGTAAQARSLSGWVSGVKLLCTIYDPASGRYRFDYSIFIGTFIGIVCLGGVAVFVVRAWRESKPQTPQTKP